MEESNTSLKGIWDHFTWNIWNFWFAFAVVFISRTMVAFLACWPCRATKVLFPVQWCLFQQYSLWENPDRLGSKPWPFGLWFMVHWLGNVTLVATIAALCIINKSTNTFWRNSKGCELFCNLIFSLYPVLMCFNNIYSIHITLQ